MARPARAFRPVEEYLQPLFELGSAWCLGWRLQSAAARRRRDRLDHRRLSHPSAPRRLGWERGIQRNALGRSRGGFSTKLHAIVDAKARPLHIALTPGQWHETTAADELLSHARGRALIGDTGYDTDDLVAKVRRKGMKVVICNHPRRTIHRYRIDRALYRRRYLVEVFFHQLKRFRAVATRYEKTARNYLALVQLACAALWLN